jgi:hypothetical protein
MKIKVNKKKMTIRAKPRRTNGALLNVEKAGWDAASKVIENFPPIKGLTDGQKPV